MRQILLGINFFGEAKYCQQQKAPFKNRMNLPQLCIWPKATEQLELHLLLVPLIDLIFTNQPDLVSFLGVSHVGISDHSLVYAFWKVSIPPASKGIKLVNYRQFKQFESVNFRADITMKPKPIKIL